MDLHNKYRPFDFDEMLGQDHIIKPLKGYEKSNSFPHAFLMVGGAGCGKTTTARIIADKLGADKSNIVEIDAASNSGVEKVRELVDTINYKGFGKNPTKVFIYDEVHSFSKAAWQALLKPIEEPPEYVYFILCTTELEKVPKTIVSRCKQFNFKDLSNDDLFDIIDFVSVEEEINLNEKSIGLIAKESQGSARLALSLLDKCRWCKNFSDIKEALEAPDENRQLVELCRLLVNKNPTWKQCANLIKQSKISNAESARLMIVNYVAKVIENETKEQKVVKLLNILESFSSPYNQSEKLAPLFLSLGSIIFEVEDDE